MLIDYGVDFTCDSQSRCLKDRVAALGDVPIGDVALDFLAYGDAILQSAANAFVNDIIQDRWDLTESMTSTAGTVCTAWNDMQQIDAAVSASLTKLLTELQGA